MSFFMDATSLLLWHLLNLPTAANFRFPYGSTSPADFWNKRWNLPVSQAMRSLVYDPFLEGKLIKPLEKEKVEDATEIQRQMPSSSSSLAAKNNNNDTKLLRRVCGVLLVFTVSGVMHELMYWYVTGHVTRSVLWLRYFMYWGVIVVVEGALKQPLKRAGVKIPVWMQWILTTILCKFLTSFFLLNSCFGLWRAVKLITKLISIFLQYFLSLCSPKVDGEYVVGSSRRSGSSKACYAACKREFGYNGRGGRGIR
jgi:Membrane bound O-acyl transferase family